MANFCSNCGSPCQEGAAFCSACGARIENNAAPQQVPVQQPGYYVQQPTNALGMKWFKFIIYFQLFASAILNVLGNFGTYNQMKEMDQYRGILDALDTYIDGNQTWAMIVLVAGIALAVYAFLVRSKLANFKVDGPKQYLIFLVLNIVVTAVYFIAVILLTNDLQDAVGMDLTGEMSQAYAFSIGSLIGSSVMIFVNKAYFDKRIHLFLNY